MPASLTGFTVRLDWPKDQPRALPANQFAVAMGVPTASGPDTIYLMIGHADPPIISSSDEGATEDVNVLPIEALGRYVLTRSRLDELIKLLQNAAEAYDEAGGQQHDRDARDRPDT